MEQMDSLIHELRDMQKCFERLAQFAWVKAQEAIEEPDGLFIPYLLYNLVIGLKEDHEHGQIVTRHGLGQSCPVVGVGLFWACTCDLDRVRAYLHGMKVVF